MNSAPQAGQLCYLTHSQHGFPVGTRGTITRAVGAYGAVVKLEGASTVHYLSLSVIARYVIARRNGQRVFLFLSPDRDDEIEAGESFCALCGYELHSCACTKGKK